MAAIHQIAITESNMAECQVDCQCINGGNQWMSEVSFVQMVGREVWVKCFCANGGNQSWQVWVGLRGKTQMAEFKIAKLQDGSQYQDRLPINQVWVRMNEWSSSLWQNWVRVPILASVSEFERKITKMDESKMASNWIQHGRNSRWLPSSSLFRMNEWSFFVQDGGLVWFRVRVEWECVWVNLEFER